MLEIFHHLLPPDFDWLFLNYSDAIYIILFAVIFIETGFVIMPFLPGDSLLFLAGLSARAGYLNISFLILLLFFAAVLGDNLNYWMGRKIGLKIFNLKLGGRLLVKKEYLDKTHVFFEKHGTKAIILARFVPFVRTFAPFAAGVGKMDYKRFFLFDLLGGFIWVAGLSAAGYLLGNIEFIKNHVDLVCIAIVLISVLPIVYQYIKILLFKSK
jgi:membrane-associated protein